MNGKSWILLLFVGVASVLIMLPACKSKSSHEEHAGSSASGQKQIYHCPMHPSYTSDKPGVCPICNMNLVLVEQGGHDDAVNQSTAPAGVENYAPFRLSREREQLIGVKTGEAAVRELKKVIRASARVAYDTELYNSISEYKAALTAREKIKESPWPDVHDRADALVRAASFRLKQMGLSESQIRGLQNDNQDPSNLLLGEKGGSIWVYAQVYEYEADMVRPEQEMEVTSPALPGRQFFGKIRAVDPILSSETRSLRVRAQVPNPNGLLKPEMFVNAKIHVNLGSKLSVPEDAVLSTGERQVVFVVSNDGRYEPRTVVTGQEADGYYEIVSGLSQGEKIVTSANFLIDSESRLKSAVSGTGGHSH